MEVKATEMSANAAEKVTRERLRAMRDGEEITVTCKDGYDMDSQKKHRLRAGQDRKLPLFLQKRWAETYCYPLWCKLSQPATRIGDTASGKRQNCWEWNATRLDAGSWTAAYALA